MATVTLGRDGMGADFSEDDFDAWVAFVSANIADRCGFDVDVEEAGERDVQVDLITNCDSDDKEIIRDAIRSLWDTFCAR